MKLTSIQNEVIDSFIKLTEKISNGKTNILDFGSNDMVFYRGEIHIIKMIGDYPGIYSSEIARNFGITRAVVHKTLLKLEKRNLVEKKQDLEDKKRQKLYIPRAIQILDDIDEKYEDYQIIENFCLGEIFKTYKSSGYEFLKEKYNNKKTKKLDILYQDCPYDNK